MHKLFPITAAASHTGELNRNKYLQQNNQHDIPKPRRVSSKTLDVSQAPTQQG
ncbi:MAG: hypothetical protein KJ064_09975 [Anaerolineae bacterium]|nr:hypothetical protein [Anaerolineae bacterium]